MGRREDKLLFYKGDLNGTLQNLERKALRTVHELDAEQVAPSNNEALLQRLHAGFVVNPIELLSEQVSREGPREVEMVLSGHQAFAYGGGRVKRRGLEVVFVVSFRGDPWLFDMRPSRWTSVFPRAVVGERELRLAYRTLEMNADQLKKDYEHDLHEIEEYVKWQEPDIKAYNDRIIPMMHTAAEQRRKHLGETLRTFADSLGVPERRSPDIIPTATTEVPRQERGPKGPKVFLCHAKEDSAKADEICLQLEEVGASLWLDSRKLVLGDSWQKEIEKAVGSADAFVVLLRPGFDAIGFRQKEVRWAIEALGLRPPDKGFIVPFLIEPCELPDWCKPFHAGSDLSRPSTLEDLIKAIEKHCNWRRTT